MDELDERARERAIEHERDMRYQRGNPWQDENIETLNTFCEIFPCKWDEVRDYSHGGRVVWTYTGDDDAAKLTGARLMAYVWNNYSISVCKGKYYSTPFHKVEKSKEHPAGLAHTSRRSRVLKECRGSGALTGYCLDEDILAPVYDVLDGKHVSSSYTFHDMLGDCMDAWYSAAEADDEHFYSEEAIMEDLRESGAYFTEQGTREE